MTALGRGVDRRVAPAEGVSLPRLRLARMFAAGSNDIPGWRTLRRRALAHLLSAPDLRMGSHVRLDRSHPELGGCLVLGSGVDIGPRVIIDVSGGLVIEDEATLSVDSLVLTHDHVVRDGTFHWRAQGKVARPLVIGAQAWVGARATVLGGVTTIGRGAVIGAAAVVTKPVDPLAVVVGVPARVVHYRET
jgi:acetyltransferase-like isoleucine patch superfamily enzyme